MTYYYSPMLDTQYIDDGATHHVLIKAIVDEETEYTGKYRITIDGTIVTELAWKEDGRWEETGKGETERARQIGALIANNKE